MTPDRAAWRQAVEKFTADPPLTRAILCRTTSMHDPRDGVCRDCHKPVTADDAVVTGDDWWTPQPGTIATRTLAGIGPWGQA